MTRRLVRSLPNDGKPLRSLTDVQRRALQGFRQKLASGEYRQVPADCLCGASPDSGILVGEKDRYGLPVTTLLCPACGLLWTSPRLDDASRTRFYEDDYRLIYSGWHTSPDTFFQGQVAFGRRLLRQFGAHFPSGAHPTVYDIGCAAGGALLPFREAGYAVAGCDLSEHAMAAGRQHGLDLRVGEPDVLRDRGPADLVIVAQVLEHLPEPHRFVEQITTSLLKPGGLLFVGMPGLFEAYHAYHRLGRYLQNAHLYHYSLHTTTRLMALVGFRLISGTEEVAAVYQQVGPSQGRGSVPDPAAVVAVRRYLAQGESIRSELAWHVRANHDRLKTVLRLARSRQLGRAVARRLGRVVGQLEP